MKAKICGLGCNLFCVFPFLRQAGKDATLRFVAAFDAKVMLLASVSPSPEELLEATLVPIYRELACAMTDSGGRGET